MLGCNYMSVNVEKKYALAASKQLIEVRSRRTANPILYTLCHVVLSLVYSIFLIKVIQAMYGEDPGLRA